MADNRNISLSDRLRAKGVQVGPLKTTPHQRVVGDTMAGQRNPETGLTQRLINKGVKINFVPSRSQSSQEQQASTQDTQAPFQSNLKETQLEVTKSNAELEIPRSNADRQKIRSAKDSDSLSKVLNEQDYMGEDQKAAQHLKVAQHAEKMAANAERSFENAQRGNFKSSKLLQGIYEQYGGKTTPSGQVVFENPAAAKLYDETAQQIANDEKQRAENFAAVQKNSEQEVENNEKRKEEASQHIILDVAPQKKQNYVSMSQADFDSAYGKVSVQQTISLQQAISEYTNLLVQKNAFEKEYGYTGNDFIWEDGNLEAEYDALEEAEEAAFEKMRNEYNAFLKTDAPKNDLYAQLILMYYTRAFDEHALDSYLDANNIKVLVSDTDSDLQNVKNSINNTVYKEHMQTVKNYQEFIAHYDERIAEISNDPLFMMSDIFLLQAANEQRQYEAYLKRNPDGVPPETDSKEDWTYFVASVVSSEDYADYAYVDKEILYPAIYQQKGKQQPTYEQQPAYAKNVQQGNLSENEKLFLAVNGASTRTNMVLGFTTYMSDDEIAVFNYLYQNPKYGPAVAKKFYEAITPDLKTRSTSNMEYLAAVRRADDVSDFGRIAEIAYAGVTGLANGLIGLVQWIPGTEDWNKTNTMASQIVRQNQPYLLRQVSNAAESIGFMTPSLVASYFGGPIAGAATTFASSGGRAAAEGREMGMSTAQSIGYGMLVGGAEAGFQYMLGGISQLRGTQSSFFGNLAKKAATTAGKMAVKFVGNVTSEIVEENLQNYWEPACKMIVGFTDQYDAPTVQDFIDTTISTIITTGVIEASNIKSTKAIMQYEQEVIAPWVEEALKYAKSGSNMQAIATKFKGMLDSGETITPKEFIDSCESITEEDKNDYTNAVIEEVQKRVEAVQMSNPEAQVVTSASTQSYLNQGIDLKTAQQAGEVLDGIVSGEITSENLSNNQIEKLNLMQPNMAAVASETLGLEIERPNSKSAARNTARQVIAQYAQQKASTASSGQDISMQQQTPVTTEAETEAAPQTTSEASTAMPETVTAPSIQTVSAPQTTSEASAATPEASVPIAQSPAVEQTTAVSSQKAQAEGKGNFITEYVAKNPNATDTEISAAYDAYRNGETVTSSTARDTANPTIQTMEASTQTVTSTSSRDEEYAPSEMQYQDAYNDDSAIEMMAYSEFVNELYGINKGKIDNSTGIGIYDAYERAMQSKESVMSPKEFADNYQKINPKAKAKEIIEAYNKYLNEPTDSKKYSEKEYGVVRDEYSEKVPEKAVEAVDALAELFKLNIHFAELGEDNGLYDPDTGEIWLDIHPHKAFEFVAGHEIAHALKARISEAAWNNFERYAVKAMGGKTAVAEKQTISEKYAKESDAREEVACDFVGKLLSDKQMLKDFCYAVEHRQIRPEAAKGLINVWKWFTGKFTNMTKKGDTETAELVAKVKEAFDTDIKTATEAIKALQTAYQEATKSDALRKTENTTNDGGVKHLIKSTPDGKKYVQADRQVIFGNDPESWSDQLEDYINGKIRRSENVTLIADDGDILTLTSRTAGKISDNHNSDGTLMDSEIFARKVSAGSHIDELATISMRGVRTVQDTYGKHAEDALKGWNYRTAYFRDNDGEYYKLTISVQQGSDGNAVYNIGKIQKRSFPTISGSSVKNGAQSDKEAYNGIIADKSESVNPSEAKNIKRDAKTTSDAEFFATEEGKKLLEAQSEKPKKRTKEDFRFPTKAEADALSAKIAERKAQEEAERIKRRDEFMTRFVREAPANKKAAEERAKRKAAAEQEANKSVKYDKKTMPELVEKYGAIDKGEKPVRDVSVPVSVDGETKVSKLVRTAMEAKVTPEEAMPMFEEGIMEGMFSYKTEKNAAQIEKAESRLGSVTNGQALASFYTASGKGKLSTNDVADGIVLYQRLCAEARSEIDQKRRNEILNDATTVLAKLSALVRKGAQVTQMARMIKNLDPNRQYYALEQVVLDLQKSLDKKFKDKAPKIEIPKDLANRWLKALKRNDEVEIEACRQLLYEGIAEQVPTQWADKFNAWRYLSMLGNPKTIKRNFGGNAVFTPVKAIKDKIGAAIELITLDKSKRTKYLGSLYSTKKGRALLTFAEQDFATLGVQETVDQMSIGKYSDKTDKGRLADVIHEKNSKFNSPVLKQWQEFTNWAMNDAKGISDKAFMKHHFKSSFAQAAMARGYSAEQLVDGSVSQSELDYLRAYAVKQALMATYRDANAVSNALAKLSFNGNGLGSKIGNILIGGALPFRGTPANIAVRAVEYSPLALLRSLSTDIHKLRKGDITGADYIENLSKSFSGTSVFFIGWLLSSLGVLRTGADDDDEREGRQAYSLEIGDISVTLDWLAPESIPFFMGAEVQKYFAGTSDADGFIEGLGNAFEPMLEFSMLSGINDLISTAFSVGDYGEAELDITQIITGVCLQPFFSYVGQYIPTLLSQAASTLEPNRTQTYVGDIEGRFEKTIVRMLAGLTEKIPLVDWRQIDYIDNYGRKDDVKSSWLDYVASFANNFFNPAYVSKIDATDVDSEIRRLEDMTGAEISPSRRGYTITVNGEKIRLDADQFEQYQLEYGKQYLLMATALVMSDEYVMMSNADQVKAFEEIESLADVYGKMASGVGYEPEVNDSNNVLYNLYTVAGIPVAEAYALRLTKSQLSDDKDLTPEQRKLELAEMINGVDGWSDEQRQAAYVFALEPSAPEIGDAEYTDEQKEAYEATYGRYVNEVYGSIMSTPEFEDAETEVKTDMLSQATELARFYAKRDWAIENGLSSESYHPKTETNKYDQLIKAGLTFFDAYEIHQKAKEIEDMDIDKDIKSTTYKTWLYKNSGLTTTQRDLAYKLYGVQWYHIEADISKYDDAISIYGFTPEEAQKIYEAINGLEPAYGEDEVSYRQKNQAILNMGMSDSKTYDALMNYNTPSTSKKIKQFKNKGIPARVYVSYYNAKYTQGNMDGTWSQAELEKWLKNQNLSNKQRDIIWKLTNSEWKYQPFE